MASNTRISSQEEKESWRGQANLRLISATHGAALQPPEITGRRLIAGVLGLLIVTGLFYYVSRVSQRMRMQTQVEGVDPADGEGEQSEVQFSDLQMSQTTANDPLELRGRVLNAGNHLITGAIVQLTFKDSAGRNLFTIQKPIRGMTEQPDQGVSNDFSGDPIEPEESRPFRVVVRKTPDRWNRNLPEVKVITVSTDFE